MPNFGRKKEDYLFSASYSAVKNYVVSGLPKDHWYCEMKEASTDHDSETDMETKTASTSTSKRKKAKKTKRSKNPPRKKVWYDTKLDSDTSEYYDYPQEIRDAARFRDGLVADGDVFPDFINVYFETTSWAERYRKHSEQVFNYLVQKEEGEEKGTPSDLCTKTEHKHFGNGLCGTCAYKINLMSYHMDNLKGYQSQSLMRDKVLSILQSEWEKLPIATKPKPLDETVVRYVHSLATVLHTLVHQWMWIDNKIYSTDDLQTVFNVGARIQETISRLVSENCFDDPDMYKTFVRFHNQVKAINNENNGLDYIFTHEKLKPKRFFSSQFLKKLEGHKKLLEEKYGVWPPAKNNDEDDSNNKEDDDNKNVDSVKPETTESNISSDDESIAKKKKTSDSSKRKRKR